MSEHRGTIRADDDLADLAVTFNLALALTPSVIRKQLGDRIIEGGIPGRMVRLYVQGGKTRGVVTFTGSVAGELDIPIWLPTVADLG